MRNPDSQHVQREAACTQRSERTEEKQYLQGNRLSHISCSLSVTYWSPEQKYQVFTPAYTVLNTSHTVLNRHADRLSHTRLRTCSDQQTSAKNPTSTTCPVLRHSQTIGRGETRSKKMSRHLSHITLPRPSSLLASSLFVPPSAISASLHTSGSIRLWLQAIFLESM